MEIEVRRDPAGEQVVAFAAAELKGYLERMLAKEAGVWSAALTLRPGGQGEPDRFSVRLCPEGGEVAGNSGRAVLLGVYDLLRRLGCRFLAPGRENEIVPALRREALALDYAHRASFYHRGVCIEGATSRENVLDFIDWLPKAGFNAFFLQFKVPRAFYARWYRHERNPLFTSEPYGFADAAADMEGAEREVSRRGLLLHKVGHGWTGEVLGYETADWEADLTPLPEEKRPFAALVNGRRGLYLGVPANTNLCLSDPDAVKRFEDLVAEYAKNHPNVDYLHIWLADEYNNVCECERCRGTTISDQYVALLNALDRRLSLEGLDTRLVFLLYQELLWPPLRERLRHPERFVLMFAPISRTFAEPCQLGEEPRPLPAYARNRITLPVDLEENLAFLRAWQEQFRGDGFVYDYPLGRAHYGDLGYLHISRVIYEDAQKLERLGLNGYLSCQELRAGLPNTLPNYVMGRVLLDRSAGFEEIVDEYFAAAYGPGWELAKACLWSLSSLQVCDYLNGKGPRKNAAAAERLERIGLCCDRFRAELFRRVPGGDRVQEGFWTRLGYHLEYAALLARAMGCLARGEEARSREAWASMRAFICRGEEKFQPWLDVYRVLEVTEKYTGLGPPEQESAQ